MNSETQSHELTRWTVDPAHTTVGFSVRHLMITNVRGVFDTVAGTVRYAPHTPESLHVVVDIPVASINTREPQRDAHLRSSDFFAAEEHPTIHFRSVHARHLADGSLAVTGMLTLRGVTRELTLTVHEVTKEQADHTGKLRMGASATAKLRRSDFGISFNKVLEAGHLAIGDEVNITLDVSLLKVTTPLAPVRALPNHDDTRTCASVLPSVVPSHDRHRSA